MKNLIKKFFFIIITGILYSSILVACAKNHFKTIIIDDKDINKSSIGMDEDKDSFKIYKYNSINSNEGEGGIEYLLGWYDNENVAAINYLSYENIVLNKINYKYSFKNKIMNINDLLGTSLASDNLAYIERKQPLKVYVKSLKNADSKLISEMNIDSRQISQLRWSKNGRYLAFSVYLQGAHNIYIYDISENQLKKIPLLGYKEYAYPEIVVSDDGQKVIVIAYEGRNNYDEDIFFMYLFNIDQNSFDANKIRPLKSLAKYSVEFINSNKIIYIDQKTNSLNIYDINLNKELIVDDNIKYFKISSDSSNIAYVRYLSQEGPNIYNCKINDGNIGDKKLLYKGFLPVDMQWSPDSKKILIKGGGHSDSRMEYKQIIRNVIDKPGYQNLIFEFK